MQHDSVSCFASGAQGRKTSPLVALQERFGVGAEVAARLIPAPGDKQDSSEEEFSVFQFFAARATHLPQPEH